MTPAKIKRLRKKMDMTQTRFAEFIGISFCTENRWEQGHHKPSPLAERELKDIEKAVKVGFVESR